MRPRAATLGRPVPRARAARRGRLVRRSRLVRQGLSARRGSRRSNGRLFRRRRSVTLDRARRACIEPGRGTRRGSLRAVAPVVTARRSVTSRRRTGRRSLLRRERRPLSRRAILSRLPVGGRRRADLNVGPPGGMRLGSRVGRRSSGGRRERLRRRPLVAPGGHRFPPWSWHCVVQRRAVPRPLVNLRIGGPLTQPAPHLGTRPDLVRTRTRGTRARRTRLRAGRPHLGLPELLTRVGLGPDPRRGRHRRLAIARLVGPTLGGKAGG